MMSIPREIELLSDIQKLVNAINNQIDSFIGTFQADSEEKQEIMRVIFRKKDTEMRGIAEKMHLKWQIK